jgi:hypothetical protein
MIGRRLHAVQIDVVKPRSEFLDASSECLFVHDVDAREQRQYQCGNAAVNGSIGAGRHNLPSTPARLAPNGRVVVVNNATPYCKEALRGQIFLPAN